MEEELNEHDLEENLYALLNHAEETENNVKETDQNAFQIIESAPLHNARRYWHSNDDNTKSKPFSLVNKTLVNKPKEVRKKSPVPAETIDLSLLKTPPQPSKAPIATIDDIPVILETSDEDEVVEVALPPKPTIFIDSSDDELQIVKEKSPAKLQTKPTNGERCVSASPVPSVVSSVSDEFIRSDCIALNISSRYSDNPSFDFSLHGPDLLDQGTPAKKKKKKRSKEAVTSTPVAVAQKDVSEECFATPKSKAKNKKKKTYTADKGVPNPDVYDSDSNQSIIDTDKRQDSYVVTEKSLPSTDVYESDSSHSELVKEKPPKPNNDVESSDSNVSLDIPTNSTPKSDIIQINDPEPLSIVDLTESDPTPLEEPISENIVMGNVSGFTEIEDFGDENCPQNDISQFGSTKIPPILNEDLDFNNLNGTKSCNRRRYSLTTLRAEMDRFYNESWGGENFNHREIQKNMSRDQSLWAIDPKDRMPSLVRRKVTCNYCNRVGHRDDTCRMKPPVCYMCGHSGHFEPRCPRKICVNCGEPNHIYSTMCRNCCTWGSIKCAECGQMGHPSSHCPDLWRRYHNTIDENTLLDKNTQTKKYNQMYCSGCTRRGHLIHTCKTTIPFSGLPINSPYVFLYRPIYAPSQSFNSRRPAKINEKNVSQNSPIAITPNKERNNKRQSKSPTVHETHANKKRNMSNSEESDSRRNSKTPVTPPRKLSQSEDKSKKENKSVDAPKSQSSWEKAPDFIPITSTNYDKMGQIIQDNEVSDTSDVVTSARIYITNDVIDKLKTKEGQDWIKETMAKHNIIAQYTDINSFLNIKGKVGDQETFQAELREWSRSKQSTEKLNESNTSEALNEIKKEHDHLSLIPKNRHNLLKQLSKAFNSLKNDIGDPKAMYKELTFFQNRHKQLLNQKIVSPKQVSNNRCLINDMFKKLNMVLLGQAGLADGSQHLNELYSYQEKLMNSNQKNIPTEQRKEIGQHYYSIFAAIPRDDYLELLAKFYETPRTFSKKKENQLPFNPKIGRFKNVNSIPPHHVLHGNGQKNIVGNENLQINGLPLRQKLVFYHQRLLKVRPNGAFHKKTRVELVKKLHSMIGSFKANLSSKTMKKIRKAQEQAQMFLANV